MIEYRKGDDLNHFLGTILILLSAKPVFMMLEPGDGTHYEFVCTYDRDRDRVFWGQIRDSGGNCGMLPGTQAFHIDYFHEKMGDSMNRYTVHLVCELHNRLFGKTGDYTTYYNFEQGRAVLA